MRQPREMTRQSWKSERAAMASKTKRKGKKKKEKEGKREKVRTRKDGLNHTKKRSSWKPEKAAWPRKEIPRLKTWKGGLRQWKLTGTCKERDFCHNQSSLVSGKTEAKVCSEWTKDIS